MTPKLVNSQHAIELRVVASPEALATEGAKLFAELAEQAIKRSQRFAVALSGGSTPIGLFDRLADDYRDRIDWARVHIFWVDERPVAPTHPDSNYGSAKAHLLDKVGIPNGNMHRIHAELPLHLAADAYAAELRQFFALNTATWPRFDLIALGVGEDGHTASLFPDTKALGDKTNLVVCNEVPKLSETRLTITTGVINAAACVLVLISGERKKTIVGNVLDNFGSPPEFPIQMVNPHDGRLIWLIDRAAASGRTSTQWSRDPDDS